MTPLSLQSNEIPMSVFPLIGHQSRLIKLTDLFEEGDSTLDSASGAHFTLCSRQPCYLGFRVSTSSQCEKHTPAALSCQGHRRGVGRRFARSQLQGCETHTIFEQRVEMTLLGRRARRASESDPQVGAGLVPARGRPQGAPLWH